MINCCYSYIFTFLVYLLKSPINIPITAASHVMTNCNHVTSINSDCCSVCKTFLLLKNAFPPVWEDLLLTYSDSGKLLIRPTALRQL